MLIGARCNVRGTDVFLVHVERIRCWVDGGCGREKSFNILQYLKIGDYTDQSEYLSSWSKFTNT